MQCPHCNVDMDKIVDPNQTHIWIEAAPVAIGYFSMPASLLT